MDIDDKELFSSAMADEPISDVADPPAEAPATEAPQPASQERAGDDRPRDEHGRFAPKQPAEPEPEPQAAEAPQEARDNAHVPPWRLREIKEERDAINARYLDTQRQLEMLQRQMPKPEPPPRPDMFENPDAAIEYGAKQYVDPQIQELRQQLMEERELRRLNDEETSREMAVKEFGREKVQEAYSWLGQMMQNDPSARQFYETRIHSHSARRPFQELMKAYQQHQITSNPDNWADKRIEERAASDPEYRAALLQRLSGQPQQQNRQTSNQPQGSITKLPPSLRNTPSARGNGADDEPSDMSDAALFRHAMR